MTRVENYWTFKGSKSGSTSENPVASAIGRRLESVLARWSVMVSVGKNEYDKRKEIKQRTREGTPIIRLSGDVKLRIDGKLGKRTFNFAISVLIV